MNERLRCFGTFQAFLRKIILRGRFLQCHSPLGDHFIRDGQYQSSQPCPQNWEVEGAFEAVHWAASVFLAQHFSLLFRSHLSCLPCIPPLSGKPVTLQATARFFGNRVFDQPHFKSRLDVLAAEIVTMLYIQGFTQLAAAFLCIQKM